MKPAEAAPIDACPHRPTCPGCPRHGRAGIARSARERLLELAARARIALDDTVEAEPLGSRHRARLMVRGRAGSPKIGLFQRGSHRIADIPNCGIHHPLVNAVARAARESIRAVDARPYADAPHHGLVRAIQVVVERATQTAQVVVVTNATDADSSLALLDALAERLGDRLHSLWWNCNPDRTNAVLGSNWRCLRGEPSVCETIGGAQVFFPPGAFGQANPRVADRIVAAVHAAVPPDARVSEFYAGSGAIGLGLARRGQRVTFNEISPAGLQGLELGIAALPDAARPRCRIVAGAAGERASLVSEADVVIVDPPRKGLDAALCDALADHPPARLVYLSCDVTSLTSDTDQLLARGRLALRRLTPYALFPFTDHVETFALFAPT